MKGISMTMQIVIVVIILLVAAMVVLSVFGVQFGGISQTVGTWLGQVPQNPSVTNCAPKTNAECSALSGCKWCGTVDAGHCTEIAKPCT
jgi:hypothetical protein